MVNIYKVNIYIYILLYEMITKSWPSFRLLPPTHLSHTHFAFCQIHGLSLLLVNINIIYVLYVTNVIIYCTMT